MNAHFSSVKCLPDLIAPRFHPFQHQAAISIDPPGNAANNGSVLLQQNFLSGKQIQLTPFLFKCLESIGFKFPGAMKKLLQ